MQSDVSAWWARTMTVFALPPSESCSKRVSLLSRYGTCVVFLPSTSAEMTLPSVVRERLILVASLSRWPSAPVFDCRSEPCGQPRRGVHRKIDEVQLAHAHEVGVVGALASEKMWMGWGWVGS